MSGVTAGARQPSRQVLLLLLLNCVAPAGASDLFPRPAGLERDVGFWVDIYTRVESHSGVLHDTRDLSVVYETLAFPQGTSRRSRSRQITARKNHYRTVLQALARGKRDGLTADERHVLAQWPVDVSGETLAAAAKRIRFQLGQADRFKAGLVRSGEYKPFIAETLEQRQLPAELGTLPHVESSFDPRAYSKVGAAGLWQFTRSTGRRYMRVDHVVDERRDPFLSTVAAARLLENNFAVTGSWPLAITGYNHGVAGMRRAARQLGTKDIETIVRNYKGRTFGFASRNFYVAFLAALQVDARPEAYFGIVPTKPAARHALLTVEDYVAADGLSTLLGLDLPTLQYYNPALQEPVWNGSKYIPRGFTLRLPAEHAKGDPGSLYAQLDPAQRFGAQLPDVTHRVRRGETLSGIADQYGLRVTDLVAMNGLRSRHQIRAGQTLNLPTRGQPLPKLPPEPEEPVQMAAAEPADQAPALVEPAEAEPVAAELPPALGAGGLPSPAALLAYMPALDIPEEFDESLAVADALLPADPSDYSVADDRTIEIQAVETLGHYSDWLEIQTQRLRDINGYSFRQPLVIGSRITLDLSKVDRTTFEARRMAYHRTMQGDFFRRYKIQDTKTHTIRRGESLWVLANRRYDVPVWLLRQFNPDLDLDQTRPGTRVQFPLLAPISTAPLPEQRIAAN